MHRFGYLVGAWLVVCAATAGTISTAAAQSVDAMLNQCAGVAQSYFRDGTARTSMQYNGQRVDGTHAINGRIFLETRYEDVACSYAPDGREMVEFFAEGRLRNAYLPGTVSGDNAGSTGIVEVTGVPANDILNVRSGPGTGYPIVGALGNGDRVRRLVCQDQGRSRWCQIEMLTDMRERAWVNARYLTQGRASQLPVDATVPGTDFNATGILRCTNQMGPTMFDCPFGVIRRGNGSGTVVVTLPTGNERRISFDRGIPVSSDAPARLTHQRTGDTTEVYIGTLERYRVPDAVIYGG